ncbi:hypothetical protein OG301_38930 (plasmid) [Streptomyces platensis]|uniref:hypothetical protein n=1 Tax=Streptomyces platensis TaxID=58346 RepID=UPI002ED38B2E|nr:hypothetical protein OG301_38930 [Streptomyces platensis]
MNSRRTYADTVISAMTSAGLGPSSYEYLTGHAQVWFGWTPGQYSVNAQTWPRGIEVSWNIADGWHYIDRAQPAVRHPLPFTITAHPMDVADSIRRLLLGLVQGLPANEDEWEHANVLLADSAGARP